MNTQIRRVAFAVLLMFAAVFLKLNWIQLVRAEELANHPSNTRLLLKEYAIARGAILTSDNQILAQSKKTPQGELKYLRLYEQGPLFAHITGYYSVRFGRTGIERAFNSELVGKGGVITIQDLGDRLTSEGERGDDVVLSIDSRMQQAAAQALGSRRGAVVALEPSSGRIIAMYSSPNFDPNPLSQHSADGQKQAWQSLNADAAKPLLSRATGSIYAPGSTFKLVTAAAALESGRGPDTTFGDAKEYLPPQTDKPMGNFGGSTCGGDMAQALKVSCNTYFARLGAELPRGALEKTARAFGFGERPPLETTVAASRLPTGEQLKSPAFAAQSAIGQFDVAATPLQMALVAAGIGNGGNVPEPRLVIEVRDSRGKVIDQVDSKIWRQAVSSQTADTLKQMMIAVVEDGTGQAAAIGGVAIAGKTGTAQVGATGEDNLAWFVAFAPADSPKIALAVVVEGAGDPRSETGGRLAAPIAKKVLEAHRGVAGW